MRVIRHLIQLVATGLVGSALVAAPASAAPTWQPITNLFADLSAAGGSAQTPAVAIDSAGNATAIWSRWDGTQLVVQASTRPAGATWDAPVDLAAGRSIFNPRLTVDPAGNVTAVWRRREVSSSTVQVASRPAGGAWTTPVDLSVEPLADYSQLTDVPQIAVDAAGIVTAMWARWETNTYSVRAATRQADGTWSTPVDLSVPGRSARNPDLAVDPAGNVTAVWVAGALIQAVSRPAGGTWTAPVDLSAIAGPRANPRIVVDPAGTATAVWGTFTTTYGVQSTTRPPGGTWTAPVQLSAPGEDTFDTPQIAVDRQGTVTAVWQRHDGSGWIITSATRTAGGSWTSTVDLSAPDHDGWDPQVAVDPAGSATATWALSDAGNSTRNSKIQAARRPAGGSWSDPVDLSDAGRNAHNPQIAIDPAGNATTAWSRHDGTSWVVQARGLDAAGPVVTSLTDESTGSGRVRAYSVKASDVWSKVASARWTFADGTTATGRSVSHPAAADGTGSVKVTLTDAVGNATVCTITAAYTCRAAGRVAPVITRASLTSHKIRAVGSESNATKKSAVKLALTTAAQVKLVFTRAGTKKSIRLIKRADAGRNTFAIRARLTKNATLQPGRWTITVTATNRAGTSLKEKLRLRVVR